MKEIKQHSLTEEQVERLIDKHAQLFSVQIDDTQSSAILGALVAIYILTGDSVEMTNQYIKINGEEVYRRAK